MGETVYYFKGNPYRIFSETKIKIDGIWVDAIIYQTLYINEDGVFWVRTKKEFFELFKTDCN